MRLKQQANKNGNNRLHFLYTLLPRSIRHVIVTPES
jgi:hypothetical protein